MTNEESLLTPNAELLDDDDLFIKPVKKHKILMLSDHPLAPSGVGIQARILIDGLLQTGRYSFRCLGGAMKHEEYRTVEVTPDFIIKPVDGFGNKELIRNLLITEKPDAILIFTDPRQFIWLWEMEDEIHQVCPITYWHVWDNDPYPKFNSVWYESTELINCLSRKTYDLVKPNFPEKTHYVPHAFPKQLYHPLPEQVVKQALYQNFNERADWFKVLWVNRNATRKLPSNVLDSWKIFLDDLEAKHGHRNALLIMHTDPKDREGPDLITVSHELGLSENVWFSTDKVSFENLNLMHNMVDCTVNISKNEGFGLSTLVSLQVGKPVVALKTGGETSKVVDYRDGSEHGAAIDPVHRSLVGSQLVPYIYEDYASTRDVADGFMKIFEMTDDEKIAMKQKCVDYVDHAFNIDNVIAKWDKTLSDTIEKYKSTKKHRWTCQKVIPFVIPQQEPQVNEVPAVTKTVPATPSAKKKKAGKTKIPTIKASL